MTERRLQLYSDLLIEIQEFIMSESNKRGKISMKLRGQLGEAYITLHNMLQHASFLPHEEVILRRALNKIYDIVYNEESLFYYSSFTYAYGNIKDGDPEKIHIQFEKINLDTMAMLLNITSIKDTDKDLGTSTENYFFTRMEKCLWAFNYVYRNKLNDHYIPSLYCLCNMIQTLILYKSTGKNKYSSHVEELLVKLEKTLKQFIGLESVQEIISENHQLKYFINNQMLDLGMYSDSDEIYNFKSIANERTLSTLRILSNLSKMNEDKFREYLNNRYEELDQSLDSMNILEKILYLRALIAYHKNENNLFEEIGLYEELTLNNTEEFLNKVFQIDQVKLADVTEQDMETLLKMKDDELRTKFSKTINGVPERILIRESEKPHGVSEISDMELPITYRGTRYYMCMPFKSGIEISSKSVPVSVSYQIVRPFIELSNCVVIFVTAKKCSENLMNYIKKLKDQQGWPIEVIESSTLAALLKHHGQL